MKRLHRLLPVVFTLYACDEAMNPDVVDVDPPEDLTYQLEPSGDPQTPAGLILHWTASDDSRVTEYRVYSRASSNAQFDLRASTSSASFHDQGRPDLDYYVTAVVLGAESGRSNTVRIDERLRLPAAKWLTSITLNAAVHLTWQDTAFQNNPSAFRLYRVYSTSYSIDQDLCGTNWQLEGTTVSSAFLATDLVNGVSRCFGVSSESREGYESLWSPLRADTPRPDARNVVLYPFSVDATRSGFRFWQDANGDGKASEVELGLVTSGSSSTIDFQIYLENYRLFIDPIRTGTTVALYGNAPVRDLTSIDVAPISGFSESPIEAVPGWGYVFKMPGVNDQFARFGAVRITHASKEYVILDWSYQTDPGNPELIGKVGS